MPGSLEVCNHIAQVVVEHVHCLRVYNQDVFELYTWSAGAVPDSSVEKLYLVIAWRRFHTQIVDASDRLQMRSKGIA